MSNDKLYRDVQDFADHAAPQAYGVPGKLAATARLSGGPKMIFRVESAEAAQVFADAFGPRDRNGVAAGSEAAVDRAASSSGSALPADLQGRFESSLGTDLSSVRIHTGAESAQAASAVGARAYTTGQDIHFGAGHYDPSSAFGVHLIAHEVAHTVQQQGAAPTRQHKLEVSAPQDGAELEADRAADAMVTGAPAPISTAAGIQRKVFRQDAPAPAAAPAAAPAGGSQYFLFSLPTNLVTLAFRPGQQLLAAIRGSDAFENAESPDLATNLSVLCSDAMWEKIPSVQMTRATGRVGKSDCTWTVEIMPSLLSAHHKGGGGMGQASSGGSAKVSSGTNNATGLENTATLTLGDGASSGGGGVKSSKAAEISGGSEAGGGSVTMVESEFQTFTAAVGFKISITRTVKHDWDYISPEAHRNLSIANDVIGAAAAPFSAVTGLAARKTGLDGFDEQQALLKKTPREEGASSFAAFSVCVGVIEVPTVVCVKI